MGQGTFSVACSCGRERSKQSYSRLHVTYAGQKVLELRWDRADHFNIVLIKSGVAGFGLANHRAVA